MTEENGTKQGYNINEAAEILGVSTRTIRRYIKANRLRATKIKGQYGEEYRILEIPSDLKDDTVIDDKENSNDLVANIAADDTVSSIRIILDLQEKNLALAAQLGAATERIKVLESQVQLLSVPKEPEKPKHWWERIFGSNSRASENKPQN